MDTHAVITACYCAQATHITTFGLAYVSCCMSQQPVYVEDPVLQDAEHPSGCECNHRYPCTLTARLSR